MRPAQLATSTPSVCVVLIVPDQGKSFSTSISSHTHTHTHTTWQRSEREKKETCSDCCKSTKVFTSIFRVEISFSGNPLYPSDDVHSSGSQEK